MLRGAVGIVALVVTVLGLAVGCGGSPPDLGAVQPAAPLADQPGQWKVVQIEGMTADPARIAPVHVEVDPDGATMTVFFQGGNPNCYTVSGVEVVRADPAIPDVTVLYGMRLWVMGCTADLASLAIRLPLEPQLER